jgi:hypothetical protein
MARLAWIRTSVSCRVHRGSRDRGVEAAAATASAAAGEFSVADIMRAVEATRISEHCEGLSPSFSWDLSPGFSWPLNRHQSMHISAVSKKIARIESSTANAI